MSCRAVQKAVEEEAAHVEAACNIAEDEANIKKTAAHNVNELTIKGEAVCCVTEKKVPKATKEDAG